MAKPSDARDPFSKSKTQVVNQNNNFSQKLKVLDIDAANEPPPVIRELEGLEEQSHPSSSTEDDDSVEQTINSWKKEISGAETPPLISPESSSSKLVSAISNFGDIFHLVINLLSFNDILTCRLVCRSWSIAVDRLLENNHAIPIPTVSPSNSTHNTNYGKNVSAATADPNQLQPQPCLFLNCRIHSSFTGPYPLEGIHLLDTATLKIFLQKMANHERNPFVGRCVRFGNYGDTTHNAAYWDNCIEILRQFGIYIWYLELSDGHVPVPNPLTCYRLIRQCLMQVPNLKSLEISFSNKDISTEKLTELVMFMKLNPLPPLQKLEKLDLNEGNASQNVQDTMITTYSKQLKAFACPMTVFKVQNGPYAFPNLRHLYITNIKTNEELSNLFFCKLPSLKILYLNLGGERYTDCGDLCNETWRAEDVLEIVKKFQLEFLSLFVAPGGKLVDNLEENKPFSLEHWNLNCLKRFEVQHCKENQYEFLKCFTTLEKIHFFDIHHPAFPERDTLPAFTASAEGELDVNAKDSIPVKIMEKDKNILDIQTFLYDGRMEDSNIWEAIPTLREVSFKCTWDREGKNLIALQELYTRESLDKNKSKKMTGMMDKLVAFVQSALTFAFSKFS